MSLSDEELQKRIEAGLPEDSIDGKAYRKVFDVLKKEPYSVPVNFADKVLDRLESRGSLSKDYIWFGLGLFVFLVAPVIAVVKTEYRFDVGAFKFLSSYSGLLLFGAVFVLIIHLVDKRLLERNLAK